MAARKKKTETAGTFVPAPRIPATPEAMLQSAVSRIVESDWDEQEVVSVVASRDRTHFSDGQRGERTQIDFTYEHPAYVVVTQRVTLDLSRLATTIAKSSDYEDQEAAVEAMFMRSDFPRLVGRCAEVALRAAIKDDDHNLTHRDHDALLDEIYDVLSAASTTRYTAYNVRSGETEEWPEYPNVYVRWELYDVDGSHKLLSVKPGRGATLIAERQGAWRVESKRWSFDSEELWPKQRGALVPSRLAGRTAGVHAPHVVEVATVAGVPNRRVFVGEKKDASFYAAELGAWLVYFRAKAKVFASKHAADAWIAGHPRAKAKAVPA